MKDVAIPQTLIQVDRDILKHCRMCSIGEIFICMYQRAPAQSSFWGKFPYIWTAVNSTFLCICTETYQPELFYTDLCFLYNL